MRVALACGITVAWLIGNTCVAQHASLADIGLACSAQERRNMAGRVSGASAAENGGMAWALNSKFIHHRRGGAGGRGRAAGRQRSSI